MRMPHAAAASDGPEQKTCTSHETRDTHTHASAADMHGQPARKPLTEHTPCYVLESATQQADLYHNSTQMVEPSAMVAKGA